MRTARQNPSSPRESLSEIERIERCLVIAAKIVLLHGPRYAPIVERLEKELALEQAALNDPMEHAKRIIAEYGDKGHPFDHAGRDAPPIQQKSAPSSAVPSGTPGGSLGPRRGSGRKAGPMGIKRAILVNGRKTSVSVEDAFWEALHDISRRRRTPMNAIVTEISRNLREGESLSSAIRVWLLEHFRAEADRRLYRNISPSVRDYTARVRPKASRK